MALRLAFLVLLTARRSPPFVMDQIAKIRQNIAPNTSPKATSLPLCAPIKVIVRRFTAVSILSKWRRSWQPFIRDGVGR